MPVGFIDEDADFGPLVEGVVVVEVDAADGFTGGVEVNHQAQLLLRGQVVVIQEKLFDVEQCIGRNGPADAPHTAVVLPSVDLLRVLGLGATECYRVVFYEHGCKIVIL